MKSRIDQRDLQHLEPFPGEQKAQVMQKIMSRMPTERVVLDGDNDFEKTVLKLRREDYGLIDLQPLEQAFSCVWYRRSKALFSRADVAMLLWEVQDPGASITVTTGRA